jgi:hypothetical protein
MEVKVMIWIEYIIYIEKGLEENDGRTALSIENWRGIG